MDYNIRNAIVDDIEKILQLISPFIKESVILNVPKEDLNNSLYRFFVVEIADKIIGVIAYYDYGNGLKEIRSLAVDQNYVNKGAGSALLNFLIKLLYNNHKAEKIFALSYKPGFFEKNGFVIVSKDTLPEKIWKDCQYCKDKENCNETALVYKKL